MDLFLAILNGLGLGVTLSFITGPAMFSLIQTSLTNGFKSGMFQAIGISMSDIFLVCLAYFGMASIFSDPKAKLILTIIGGVILIVFGTYTFTRKVNTKPIAEGFSLQKLPFWGHIGKGFIFNLVNPSVWFYWILPVSIATSYSKTQLSVAFMIAMLVSILAFDILKCLVAYKLKNILTEKVINVINKIVGIILGVIGVVMIMSLFVNLQSFRIMH